MKQLLYIITCVLVLTACHRDEPPTPGKQHYRRTVMVYMAMQNSLGLGGENSYHKKDSSEIAQAMQYIPKDDRLLLFIDDAKKPRIYELNRDCAKIDKKTGEAAGPKLLKAWKTEESSASKEMLTEMLTYMRQEFPSDSYGLVMGSHANGWLPKEKSPQGSSQHRVAKKSWGIDVGPDGSMRTDLGVAGSVPDQIEIADMASAIAKSGVHLDYILFDACLMQNIEVDYTLRHDVDYIIASPISISADGGYYTELVQYGLFSSDVADVCRWYLSYYIYKDKSYGTVVSCVKTDELDNLALTVHTLLNEMLPGMTAEEKVKALKTRDMTDALNYHTYAAKYYYRPHYYDLLTAFKALGLNDEQMQRLKQAVAAAVIEKGANDSFLIDYTTWGNVMQKMPQDKEAWCGVSMFVPQEIYSRDASKSTFGDLNEAYKSTDWYKAVYGL